MADPKSALNISQAITEMFKGREALLTKGIDQMIRMKVQAEPRPRHAKLVVGDEFVALLENPAVAAQLLAEENHQVVLAGLSQATYDKLIGLEHLKAYLTPAKPGALVRLRVLESSADLAAAYSALIKADQFGVGVPILGTDETLLQTFALIAKDRIFSVSDMSEVKTAAFVTTTNIAKFGDAYTVMLKQQYPGIKERNGVLVFDNSIQALLLEFYQVQKAMELARKAA